MVLLNLVRSSLVLGLLASLAACSSLSGEDEDERVVSSHDELQCAGSCTPGDLNGDSLLTPVTRTRGLLQSWKPQSPTDLPDHYWVGSVQKLRPDAHAAFVAMVKAAYESPERIDLYCTSGYRSFDTQCSLFANYASANGCEEANTFSAHAGHSEHQLGTVCDIFQPGSGTGFLEAGMSGDVWLKANAYKYGFANSYPHTDASQNDGYIQEVWHYRYIGKPAALELHNRGQVAVPVFIASLSDQEVVALGGTPVAGGGNGGGASGASCNGYPTNGQCRAGTTILEWCKDGVAKTIDCATTTNGFTACGVDPSGDGYNCVVPGSAPSSPSSPSSPSGDPCQGFTEAGTCTGAVLEWCEGGTYKRADCSQKTNGKTSCGTDPNPALGNNCIEP